MPGQTWHWVEPVAGAQKAAQVLRPGGRLAAFWNVLDPAPEVAEAFSAIYRRVLDDWDPWARPALDPYSAICAATADGMRAAGAFGEPEQWRYAAIVVTATLERRVAAQPISRSL